jgi:hypothetical protein
VPSAGRPSTSFGPVQPFGVRSTIIGQRGRAAALPERASDWIRRMSATALSTAAASAWCTAAGSWPATTSGAYP